MLCRVVKVEVDSTGSWARAASDPRTKRVDKGV